MLKINQTRNLSNIKMTIEKLIQIQKIKRSKAVCEKIKKNKCILWKINGKNDEREREMIFHL